ncbi:hypothetical protein DFJ73DRAFT_798228 [Zopfochytrium polystomum]|nr:hypothetical protein DFJ73DRAFT_798228 [Zopfochytrium polystomum]
MGGAIEDLSIEPSKGASTFLHGFLGVTPTLAVSGVVRFLATKAVAVHSLKISLVGTSSVRFTLPPAEKAHANQPPAQASSVLLSKSVLLIDAAAAAAAAADGASQKSGAAAGGGKKPVVQLKAGGHSFPFKFDVPEDVAASLPASMLYETEFDRAAVVYRLTAELDIAGGLLSSPKQEKVSEDVDFPRISVPSVIRGQAMDTSVTISGSNETLDWRVHVDRGIFGIGQPVTFTVGHVQAADPRHDITAVAVAVRQEIVLRAEGHTKTVRMHIAKPDVRGKITVEARAGANGGGASRSKSRSPSASGGGAAAPAQQQHQQQQASLQASMSGLSLSPAAAGDGGSPGRSERRRSATLQPPPSPSGGGVVRWVGAVQAVVESAHVRDREHRSIDAFSPCTTELISVRHAFEVVVSVRGMADVRLDAPATFVDADRDTREWVLRNASTLGASGSSA